MRRALFVGIDRYPTAPLAGCVEDVSAMSTLLAQFGYFGAADWRMLCDERATAQGIKERLQWLIQGAKNGDALLFYYSGHGVQLSTRDAQGEVAAQDDILCPFDFNMDDRKTYLTPDDFRELFEALPKGVFFTWISDSCHSGMPKTGNLAGVKQFPLPLDVGWARDEAAKALGIEPTRLSGESLFGNSAASLTYLSACGADETTQEVMLQGHVHGAMTAAFLTCVTDVSWLDGAASALLQRLQGTAAELGSAQLPQLYGTGNFGSRPLLGVRAPAAAPPGPQAPKPLAALSPPPAPAPTAGVRSCNAATVALIKNAEGLGPNARPGQNAFPYVDPVSIWTIGWGHVIRDASHMLKSPQDDARVTALYPNGISLDDAEALLKADLIAFARDVQAMVRVAVNDNEFGALVSFAFNLGSEALAGSTLLKLLNSGDFSGAAAEFPRWIYANHVPSQGLKNRRAAERKLFETP